MASREQFRYILLSCSSEVHYAKRHRCKKEGVARIPADSSSILSPWMQFLASTDPRHNLVGVGIGPKVRGGVETRTLAVRFYVVRKLDESMLPSNYRFPARIDGVPADVIEVGHIVPACAPLPGPIDGTFRPVQPGCAISVGTGSGTMGAVVEKGGRQFLLTNNHVIANDNPSARGKPVHQPEGLPLLRQPDSGRH